MQHDSNRWQESGSHCTGYWCGVDGVDSATKYVECQAARENSRQDCTTALCSYLKWSAMLTVTATAIDIQTSSGSKVFRDTLEKWGISSYFILVYFMWILEDVPQKDLLFLVQSRPRPLSNASVGGGRRAQVQDPFGIPNPDIAWASWLQLQHLRKGHHHYYHHR